MTKRSKITLFGLLALIAAFGLILTGCPDPNSETKTEWQDKPSVQVSEVSFTDGDGAGASTLLALEIVVSLPSGASWDDTVIGGLTGADFDAAFTVDYHGNAAAETAVDTLIGTDDITAAAEGQNLTITISKTATYTTTYASKISVGINSAAGIAALIADNPELTLNTHAKAWNTDKALISVEEVSFADGTEALKGSLEIKLKRSKGAWTGTTASQVAGILTIAKTGSTDPTTATAAAADPVIAGDTLTYTLVKSAVGATVYGDVTATLSAAAVAALDATATVDSEKKALTAAVVAFSDVKSQGTASYKAITGLTATSRYVFKDGDGVWYKVKTDGTFDTIGATLTAAAIGAVETATATRVTGLSATGSYDVYEYTTSGDPLVLAGTKNRMVYLTADGDITVASGAIAGITVYVIVDSAIDVASDLAAGGATPAENKFIQTGGKKWTFATNGSYTVTSMVVTYTVGNGFFTITNGQAGSVFKITRGATA